MKKAVFFISACLITAAVAACVMPFKENKEETSIFDSGVEGLPDGENGCMAGLPDGKENAVQETGGAENEPVFGSVPYFQDNTGRLVQTEDGYFYGYWGGMMRTRWKGPYCMRRLPSSGANGFVFTATGFIFWRCRTSAPTEKRYCCTG